MLHKGSREVLDPTMKDLRSNNDELGGATLLAVTLIQILPFVLNELQVDEENTCLKKASIWRSFQIKKIANKPAITFTEWSTKYTNFHPTTKNR